MRVPGDVVTQLAHHEALTYDLVQDELGISRDAARDIVLDLELDSLLRLTVPATHRTAKGRKRCVSPPIFMWVDE